MIHVKTQITEPTFNNKEQYIAPMITTCQWPMVTNVLTSLSADGNIEDFTGREEVDF